jgi:acyl carrier protein
MTAPAEYLPKIVAIAAEQFGRDDADLNGDTTLEDLRADSLDCSELFVAIEGAFRIQIPRAEEQALRPHSTLMDFARMVGKAKGEAA